MKVPTLKKCCFFLPLSKGLLCIGYVRLVLCLLTIGQYASICINVIYFLESDENTVVVIEALAAVVPQIVDMVFTLMLLLAVHKSIPKLFQIFYYYSVTMIFVYSLVMVLTLSDYPRLEMLYYMVFQHIFFVNYSFNSMIFNGIILTVLQAYISLLVKSKIELLREHTREELERGRSSTNPKPAKLDTEV